jgi:sialate O-acetylesterase
MIAGWTTTGYYFARCIQEQNPDLPLGLYECAYSGSPIECWLPMETWAGFPAFKEGAEVAKRQQDAGQPATDNREAWRMPSGMYNGMMQCLTATPVAGAIWYQGEGNAGQPDYAAKMQAMVSGWRKAWGIDFPFYYVQLAGYMGASDDPAVRTEWAGTRDLQRRALGLIPKSGMASAFDIGDINDIHPKNKVDVGERLARWALRDVYGDKKIVVSGPLYKEMKTGGGKVRVSFDYAEGGLMIGKKEGKAPTREIKNGRPGGFAVGNKDGKWAWAEAQIDGQSVVLVSPDIAEPVAVRYALSNSPGNANLYNKAGLPASPFTTEK